MEASNFNDLMGRISNDEIITGVMLSPSDIKADTPDHFSNLDDTMISQNLNNYPSNTEIKIEESVIKHEIPSTVASAEREATTKVNTMKRPRKGSITTVQKCAMIEFLDENPNLLSGKFTSTFQQKHSKMLWMTLTEELNSLPGGHKDWKQWRKTWQDLKTKNRLRQEQASKMKTRSTSRYLSIEQKNSMVAFLKKHPHLSGARFTRPSEIKAATSLWMELAETLNGMPGARRPWTHWRKTWHDIQKKAKNKKRVECSTKPIESLSNSAQLWNWNPIPNTKESLVAIIDWSSFDNEDKTPSQISVTKKQKTTPPKEQIIEDVCEELPHECSIPDSINDSYVEMYDKTLTDTVAVARQLTDSINARNEYLKSYYERKLELMERGVRIKEEISDSLKVIIARKL